VDLVLGLLGGRVDLLAEPVAGCIDLDAQLLGLFTDLGAVGLVELLASPQYSWAFAEMNSRFSLPERGENSRPSTAPTMPPRRNAARMLSPLR